MKTESVAVVVIGGGPAGMMVAATAAKRGKSVVLLEKNPKLGKKLSITGGGRCNITNNKPNVRELARAYGQNEKFLYSLFARHGVNDTTAYFTGLGVPFAEEAEGRMFPYTKKAMTVVEALERDCQDSGVVVKTDTTVVSLTQQLCGTFVIKTPEATYLAESCVLATGGTARPETGSTGEGFLWLSKLGHTVHQDTMSLVPITTKEDWTHQLAGLSFSDVMLDVRQGGKRMTQGRGKVLFTHVGLSGPAILNLSQSIGQLLSHGDVEIRIRLFPDLDAVDVREQLQKCLSINSNQQLRNALKHILPPALVGPLLLSLELDSHTPAHSVSREKRMLLARALESLPLTATGLLGLDKAVVAGGGVDLQEIDFRTMESKIVPRLFLVGDVLNINRPSGGYSLQLCWSTGAVAGTSI